MRNTALWILLIGLFSACQMEELDLCTDTSLDLSMEERSFFEIIFGNEFAMDQQNIRKWRVDVRIFVPFPHPELEAELEHLIDEINALSESTQLSRTTDSTSANFVLYFGDKPGYAENFAPAAADFIDGNFGLFSFSWDRNTFEITRASACIDIIRENDINCLKHLLREELTQALGMPNDIDNSPESIFHEEYNCTPSYTELDIKFIRYFLSKEVQAGMCPAEVYLALFD